MGFFGPSKAKPFDAKPEHKHDHCTRNLVQRQRGNRTYLVETRTCICGDILEGKWVPQPL